MFSQLFGLSFWRYPSTAGDPLVSKRCKRTHLHFGWPEIEYISSYFLFVGEFAIFMWLQYITNIFLVFASVLQCMQIFVWLFLAILKVAAGVWQAPVPHQERQTKCATDSAPEAAPGKWRSERFDEGWLTKQETNAYACQGQKEAQQLLILFISIFFIFIFIDSEKAIAIHYIFYRYQKKKQEPKCTMVQHFLVF